MTSYFKGGRGVKAPYESTIKRVPVPLAETVDELIEEYRCKLVTGNDDKPVTGKQAVMNRLEIILNSVASEEPGYKPKSATRLVKELLELKKELNNL